MPIGLSPDPPARPRRREPATWPRLSLGALRAHPTRLLGLGLAAGMVGLGLHLGLSSGYVAHGAAVSGNTRLPSALILAASGLDGTSVFRINHDAAARRIEMLVDIHRAEVGVALPNRVWIAVDETDPVLLWESPTAALVVDDTGRAIQAPGDTPGLVRVRDAVGILNAPGDRLADGVTPAARVFGARFGALTYHPSVGFGIVTPEGWPVRLGLDATMVAQQAATLAALAPRLAQVRRPVEVIDLRFGGGSYYRLKEEAR